MMTSLECGHLFCTSCWAEYLATKIAGESGSKAIEFPGECDVLVDDATVASTISDPSIKLQYQRFIVNSFVQVRNSKI